MLCSKQINDQNTIQYYRKAVGDGKRATLLEPFWAKVFIQYSTCFSNVCFVFKRRRIM